MKMIKVVEDNNADRFEFRVSYECSKGYKVSSTQITTTIEDKYPYHYQSLFQAILMKED